MQVQGMARPRWLEYTVPNLRRYAAKIGAEFLVAEHCAEIDAGRWPSGPHPLPLVHFAKLSLYRAAYDLGFDRIAYIDADCLVANDAACIFEAHSEPVVHAKPATPNAGVFAKWYRRETGEAVPHGFLHRNAGVIVMQAEQARDLYLYATENLTEEWSGDQHVFNRWLIEQAVTVQPLLESWNCYGDPGGPGNLFHFVGNRKGEIEEWATNGKFR